ncbi:hypothetical protein AB3N58_06915 [Leptospira sp. WS60.C2]
MTNDEKQPKPDETEETKKVLFGFLSERLNHPYIGTFIFSFFFYNFQSIMTLLVGLGEEYSLHKKEAINTFVVSFHFWSFDFWLPFFSMIIIPNIFHNLGDVIYRISQKGKDYLISLIDNFSESVNLDTKVNFYERKYRLLLERNKNLREHTLVILQKLILESKKSNMNLKKLRPMLSKVELNVGDLVSEIDKDNHIEYYKNQTPIYGEVVSLITKNLYLINVINKHDLETKARKIMPKDGKEYHIYNAGGGKLEIDETKREDTSNYLGSYLPSKQIVNIIVKFKDPLDIISNDQLLSIISNLESTKYSDKIYHLL